MSWHIRSSRLWLILLAATLGLVTIFGACATMPLPFGGGQTLVASAPAPATTPQEITVIASEMKLDPAAVTLNAGQPVRLTFTNNGVIEHDWEVAGLKATGVKVVSTPAGLTERARELMEEKAEIGIAHPIAGPGQTVVIEFTPVNTGTFQAACEVPGHKDAGMKGSVVVKGAGEAAAAARPKDNNQAAATPAVSDPAHGGATASAPSALPRLKQPVVAPAPTWREPRVIPIEIETKAVVATLDDGVSYEFWTFGGTVPGPMMRVRQGDTVELTLKNAAENNVTHSIDLHAVTGPGGGAKVTQVAPGQLAMFRFKALNPGVYVYHCASPVVPQHLANGMYGLIVVEPPEGLPAVDREFYLMQGDLYLQGERGTKGARAFSMEKMLDERADYIVFNGSSGGLVGDNALKAMVGETVRIFFGVGGPNVTSSFHVIGEIFDRVAKEGATEWSTNVQTTLVPTGGATIAEFKIDVPGDYIVVDHSLSRLAKGAAAIISAEGPADPTVFQSVQAPTAMR